MGLVARAILPPNVPDTASVSRFLKVAVSANEITGIDDLYVGYMNNEMVDGGQLVSASFLNPGKETFRVSDIKITGYEQDPSYFYAQDYFCDFYILDYAGRTIMDKDTYFSYLDSFDWDNGVFLGGKWSNNGTEIVPGDENDFEMSAGQAIWLFNPGGGEKPFTVTFPQTVGEQAAK